jgi:hypothetical protein
LEADIKATVQRLEGPGRSYAEDRLPIILRMRDWDRELHPSEATVEDKWSRTFPEREGVYWYKRKNSEGRYTVSVCVVLFFPDIYGKGKRAVVTKIGREEYLNNPNVKDGNVPAEDGKPLPNFYFGPQIPVPAGIDLTDL